MADGHFQTSTNKPMTQSNFAPRFERSASSLWALALGFAPWVLAPLVCGRGGASVAIIFISSYLSGLGFIALLYFRFFEDHPSLRIAFAPGTGVIINSGLLYFAVRFEFNGALLYWSTCALGWIGTVLLVRYLWQRSWVFVDGRKQWYLILVSILICLSFFVTDVRKNHVATAENGYSFLHADSTFNMAIAAAVKNGVKPWNPPLGETPLVYHYGSHSIAGCYARFTGTNLSSGLLALAGVGLISLLSAAIGLAALVTRIYGGDPILGPIAGGVGIFLFTDVTRILRTAFSFIAQISGFSVSPDIGYWTFSTGATGHFHYSHSNVWGTLGLIVVLGLTLWYYDTHKGFNGRRAAAFPLLTALVCPLNVFAGIASSITLATLAVIEDQKKWVNWLFAAMIVITTIAAIWVICFTEGQPLRNSDALTMLRNPIGREVFSSIVERMVPLFFIFIGFGVGLIPIGMLYSQPKHPLPLISLLLAIGGFAFSTFVDMGSYSDDRYFLRYFYHFSVVCSIAILSGAFREWNEGRGTNTFVKYTVGVWGILTLISAIFLSIQVCGLVVSLTGVDPFHDGAVRILSPIVTASLSYWLWRNVRTSVTARYVSLAILTCIVLLQIAGSIRAIYIYVFKMPMVSCNPLVVVDSNELKGLFRLYSLSAPNDLCATNRHIRDDYYSKWLQKGVKASNIKFQPGGVLYTPLSERRFLIEASFPLAKIGSDEVRSENKLLFDSMDIEAIRNVINKHKIRYLVCEPATDLAIAKSLPSWLYKIPDTGSLKIYQVRD